STKAKIELVRDGSEHDSPVFCYLEDRLVRLMNESIFLVRLFLTFPISSSTFNSLCENMVSFGTEDTSASSQVLLGITKSDFNLNQCNTSPRSLFLVHGLWLCEMLIIAQCKTNAELQRKDT